MDEWTIEDLSAYLDGELDREGRARVEDLVATSAEARSLYERLAAGRELARSSALASPTQEEAAALDAAVLASIAPTTAASSMPARRSSPRRRGRPPWPYFAAAAAFALVLSLGIAVLAQVVGREGSREATTAVTTTAADETAASPSPSARMHPAAPSNKYAPPTQADAQGAAPPPASAQLYLSGVRVDDTAGLAALAQGTTPPLEPRDAAIAELVTLAHATGTDLADLSTCLASTAPGVPVRVDVGSYGGQPAYLVVTRGPTTADVTVTALARGTCARLATVPAAP